MRDRIDDGLVRVRLRELHGEQLADDSDLLALLLGKLGAPRFGIDLLGLLALLDHLGEKIEHLGVGGLALAGRARGDVAVLYSRADQPERRHAALVLRPGGMLQGGGDGLAHGVQLTLFQEEASKVIERVRSGKGICKVNLLFSQ